VVAPMASPMPASCLRLMSDLKAIQCDPPEGCSASPLAEDNMYVWTATVMGPEDTPWEGGIYSLRITFSDRYPDKPPRVRFTTKMFHPNVSAGFIQQGLGYNHLTPFVHACIQYAPSMLTQADGATVAATLTAMPPSSPTSADHRSMRTVLCAWTSSRTTGAPSTTSAPSSPPSAAC
jgi:ubiquitin-conjugating enzyme E2 A